MRCVNTCLNVGLRERESNIYFDIYLISTNSDNMVSFTKATVAFLLACRGFSAATPPSDDTLDLDDTLPLNDTLPLDGGLPLNNSLTHGDQPKREDWKSARIWCEYEEELFFFKFKISGEGWLRREEEVERKVKTAADKAGSVAMWKVAHYPPQEDRNSSVTITVSSPVPCVVASRWCSYYFLKLGN